MTKMEKEKLKEVISAMTDEEKEFIIRFIPTLFLQNELIRRDGILTETVNCIKQIVKDAPESGYLMDDEETIGKVDKVLKEFKYSWRCI